MQSIYQELIEWWLIAQGAVDSAIAHCRALPIWLTFLYYGFTVFFPFCPQFGMQTWGGRLHVKLHWWTCVHPSNHSGYAMRHCHAETLLTLGDSVASSCTSPCVTDGHSRDLILESGGGGGLSMQLNGALTRWATLQPWIGSHFYSKYLPPLWIYITVKLIMTRTGSTMCVHAYVHKTTYILCYILL